MRGAASRVEIATPVNDPKEPFRSPAWRVSLPSRRFGFYLRHRVRGDGVLIPSDSGKDKELVEL